MILQGTIDSQSMNQMHHYFGINYLRNGLFEDTSGKIRIYPLYNFINNTNNNNYKNKSETKASYNFLIYDHFTSDG